MSADRARASGCRCTSRTTAAGERAFDATLSLARREPARPAPLLRYPAMTLQVVAGIYLNALRLKLKGAPYHPHPAR